MTSVIMIVRVANYFKDGDNYFVRCWDNGMFIKCLLTEKQYEQLKQDREKGSLFIITGYYVKFKKIIMIQVDSIAFFNYKDLNSMCNIDNPKYVLSPLLDFEEAREKKGKK